jgi:AraC-like DNA-binding protein
MIATLTEIVLVLTGFQLVMLALVLLTRKEGSPLNRYLLAAFLLSKAFLTIRWITYHFGVFAYGDSPYLYHLSCSAFFLLAPLLFVYVKSLCYKDFRLRSSTLVHLSVFLLILLFQLVSVRIMLSDAPGERSLLYGLFVSSHGKIFWSANLLQIFFYILGMLITVRGYRTQLKNRYSSVERIDLNWLVTLLLIIFLHWLFVVSRSTLSVLEIQAPTLTSLIDLFSITIFLGFTTALVFKGLQQLKVFEGIERQPKYQTSKLTDASIQEHAENLEQYMELQKPYLDSSLTLEQLSHRLSLQSWDLSRVLNGCFGQNFFNFVNAYRIQEAQRLLSDTSNGRRTVLQVVYDAGFNSKSAFNAAFRKHTGMTPSEFKRNTPPSSAMHIAPAAFFPHKKRPAL